MVIKSRKGCLKYLKYLSALAPISITMIMGLIFYKRLVFNSRVCFCDFKDKLFNHTGFASLFQTMYNVPIVESDYYCLEKERLLIDSIICYEIIFQGIFFFVILYTYYISVMKQFVKQRRFMDWNNKLKQGQVEISK
jgi:hypothetical protein